MLGGRVGTSFKHRCLSIEFTFLAQSVATDLATLLSKLWYNLRVMLRFENRGCMDPLSFSP